MAQKCMVCRQARMRWVARTECTGSGKEHDRICKLFCFIIVQSTSEHVTAQHPGCLHAMSVTGVMALVVFNLTLGYCSRPATMFFYASCYYVSCFGGLQGLPQCNLVHQYWHMTKMLSLRRPALWTANAGRRGGRSSHLILSLSTWLVHGWYNQQCH